MKKISNIEQPKAVITVYFSLAIGLILAMLCTSIEAARTAAANTYISRVLQTAMESSLSDYYLPLFERYQLFGLHLANETEEEKKGALAAETSECMNESFSPKKSSFAIQILENNPTKNFLLCNPAIKNVEVTQTEYLMDDQGQGMIHQAAAYMKYKAPVSILESLLEAKGMLEDTEKSTKITKKKLEVEETCTKIDQKILQLITLIDGVRTDEEGIWQSWLFENLGCTDIFIKKLVNFEVSQSNVGINHKKIYELVKDEYEHSTEDIRDLLALGRNAYAEYEKLRQEEVDAGIPPEDSMLLYLEQDTSVSYSSDCIMQAIWSQTEAMLEDTIEAIGIIEEIGGLREQARQQMNIFESELEKVKAELPEGLYEELLSESPDIKQYANKEVAGIGMIYDIHQMYETLLSNKNILSQALLNRVCSFTFETEGFQQWESTLSAWCSLLDTYSHQGLVFDYSKISFDKEKNNITSTIRNFVASGTASLVLEKTNQLSEASLSGTDLPSKELGISSTSALSNIMSMLTSVSGDTADMLSIDREETSGGSEVTWEESILFLTYLASHTTNYCSDNVDKGQILSYEQEYLLFGNLKDQDNLNCCILRLIELRTIVNFIYLLTDQSKKVQARTFALSTVGMTGLTFLVSAVTYIILFAWAVVQSMVEVSALLMGKDVALISSKNNFVVLFTDLLMVSNSYITEKAKKYDAKSLAVSYDTYLLLLLFLRVSSDNALRMMDLIQENLRYEYEDEFRIQNCLTGYKEDIICTMPPKFLFLPWFNECETKIDSYEFQKTNYVSY